jgi:hypothetical protein
MLTNNDESVGQFLVRGHKGKHFQINIVLLIFLRFLGSFHTQYILEQLYLAHESLVHFFEF